MPVYCDLNVLEANSLAGNLAIIKRCIHLGFHVVAINRMHGTPKKQSKDDNSKSQISSMKQTLEKVMLEIKKDNHLTVPENFQLLSRLTFTLTSDEELNYLRSRYYADMLDNFDLIAFIPTNEKVFKAIMTGKLLDVDIISFQMENKFEYNPSKELIRLGVSKEVAFELSYSTLIKSVSLRKYIFHNCKMLVNKMKKPGQGIILSSGGEHVLDFRGPQDVANLANLFDIKGAQCQEVISRNCQKVIRHSLLRNTTFKGAVLVEKIDDIAPETKKKKVK